MRLPPREHFADRAGGTGATGAFRPPRVPAADQKFAGCFQINFEGAGVSASLPQKRWSPFPALGGSVLRSSETRRNSPSGRSVEEVKKRRTVEGAVRGFWGGGDPGGRRSLGEAGPRARGAPRRLPRGRRRGEVLGTPRANWPSPAAPQPRSAAPSRANRRGPQEASLGPGLGAGVAGGGGPQGVPSWEPAVPRDRALSRERRRSRGFAG